MAAMSAVPTASTITPPSSSHENNGGSIGHGNMNGYSWNNVSSVGSDENPMYSKKTTTTTTTNGNDRTNGHSRSPLLSQNGNSGTLHSISGTTPSRNDSSAAESLSGGMAGAGYLSPSFASGPGSGPGVKTGPVKDTSSPADSLLDLYGTNKSAKRSNVDLSPAEEGEDENSKWIHRDKLARIESEELQAAGIILPAPRARSRPRPNGPERVNVAGRKAADPDTHGSGPRSRKNSTATGTGAGAGSGPVTALGTGSMGETRLQEVTIPSWDLRTPEEIAEANYWTSINGPKGSSRIPVAKLSPVPIPADYLGRDTPAARKRDSSPVEDGKESSIKMPKTRARSSSTSTKLEAASSSPGGVGAAVATGGTTSASHQSQPRRAATDVSPKKNATAAGSRKSSVPAKAIGANGRPKTRGAPSKDSTSSGSGTTRPSTRSGERELSPNSPGNKQPEGDPPWMVSAYKPDPRLPPDQQLLPTVARRLQQEKWEREGKFGSIYDREFRPLTDDGFLSPPEPRASQLKDESKEKPDEKAEDWPLKAEPKSPTSNSLRQQRTGSYSTIPKIQDPPVSPIPGSRGNVAPSHPSPLIRVPEVPAEELAKKEKGCLCCVVM